ncbi:Dna2/Cas4 domain-containing protein [Candidatus Saccharibacteria bacterium]|nr:Dna2/Cas4 domain-containing protein [Candidatus Saccharibacteria bacterium]
MQSQLSKSEYMMFLKHPAWAWLKKHDKAKLPPVDANTQAVFDTGNLFENYAEARFPKGVRLGFNDFHEYRSLPDRTAAAITSGEKTLFQARFEAGRYTCITDVIDQVGEGEFDLYEIKSSTGVKTDHILDLAFQVMVMELAGYKIRRIYVIYVNKTYVRKVEINSKELTAMSEVTDEVRAKHSFTMNHAAAAIKTIDQSTMPDPSPAHCQYGSLSEWLQSIAH